MDKKRNAEQRLFEVGHSNKQVIDYIFWGFSCHIATFNLIEPACATSNIKNEIGLLCSVGKRWDGQQQQFLEIFKRAKKLQWCGIFDKKEIKKQNVDHLMGKQGSWFLILNWGFCHEGDLLFTLLHKGTFLCLMQQHIQAWMYKQTCCKHTINKQIHATQANRQMCCKYSNHNHHRVIFFVRLSKSGQC